MEAATEIFPTREAILPEPRVSLKLIKEGIPPTKTEKQKAYEDARHQIFSTYTKLDNEKVLDVLTTRKSELEEAIGQSPLKSASDRNGNTLGNLRDLTELAIDKLTGKLEAKDALNIVFETITDEEERKIINEARDSTRKGLVVDKKSGGIYLQSFPSDFSENLASTHAQNIKSDFLKGKENVQQFISNLK